MAWDVDISGIKSTGGAFQFFRDKLVGMKLDISASSSGDLLVSGSVSFRTSFYGIEIGATVQFPVLNAVMDNSGLLGIAARSLQNRNSDIDRKVNCMVTGAC